MLSYRLLNLYLTSAVGVKKYQQNTMVVKNTLKSCSVIIVIKVAKYERNPP